jgi:hypothetical protein
MARYYRSRRGSGPFAASAVLAGAVLAAVTAHGAKGTAAATATGAGRASASAAVTTGQRMAAAYGWGSGGEWSCLDALWTRESSWNPYAANPTSDARGIPQDINGWNDFAPGDVHAQVAWGLSYVRGRYGDACTAWSHETSDSWY